MADDPQEHATANGEWLLLYPSFFFVCAVSFSLSLYEVRGEDGA
jgi:hypothetical protein